MKCPYLEGIYFQWCKATKGSYVPSQFEFNEYCMHGGYKMCPGYYNAASEKRNEVSGRDRLVTTARG